MAPIAGPAKQASHDYTEGASALDIDGAVANNRRSRRDSQHSTMYGEDGEGAMFSGPGYSANPSSVSRMSYIEPRRRSSDNWTRTRRMSRDSGRSGRRSLSRRLSKDSQVSRQSIEGRDDAIAGEEDALMGDGARRPRRDSASPTGRVGVFGNLAHLFGRTAAPETPSHRRRSVSQLSLASTSRRSRRSRRSDAGSDYALETDDDDEERWGYSSGEEDSEDGDSDSVQSMAIIHDNASITASMEYDSEPPSPSHGSYGIPLMSSDPIFGGEARLDMETPFSLQDPPPPGPPSRQTIYISDEDSTIRLIGYETVMWRAWMWRFGCVTTLGVLSLLGHWFPRLWLRWVTREKAFIDSQDGFVVVEVGYILRNIHSWFDGLQDCFYRYYTFSCPLLGLSISHNHGLPICGADR